MAPLSFCGQILYRLKQFTNIRGIMAKVGFRETLCWSVSRGILLPVPVTLILSQK